MHTTGSLPFDAYCCPCGPSCRLLTLQGRFTPDGLVVSLEHSDAAYAAVQQLWKCGAAAVMGGRATA